MLAAMSSLYVRELIFFGILQSSTFLVDSEEVFWKYDIPLPQSFANWKLAHLFLGDSTEMLSC